MGTVTAEELPDGASVLMDSAPVIYAFEDNPIGERFRSLFAAIEAGRLRAIVTPVTLAEVVTGALQRGDEFAAARYRSLLTSRSGWRFQPLDVDTSMEAASLRARHRLKLPDAIQLATALRQGCAALATHDRDFPEEAGVPLIGPPPKTK